MNYKLDTGVDETVHRNGHHIFGVDYVYKEYLPNGEVRTFRVAIKRQEYEKIAATKTVPTLPFDSFAKVLRPFMMGKHVAKDIPEAFRLLDADHSGTIDIGELAAFMPVIVPNANPYMLIHHIQKADKNGDYKLNLAEFTSLINQGIGRDIALGRL
jgi:Ca2+-binding EF-hand superfamily protein